MRVRVPSDYGKQHLQGAVGTTVKRYGVPGYAAFEVSLPDGRMELFWDHQLEEAPLPAKRRWSTGRRPVTHEPAL